MPLELFLISWIRRCSYSDIIWGLRLSLVIGSERGPSSAKDYFGPVARAGVDQLPGNVPGPGIGIVGALGDPALPIPVGHVGVGGGWRGVGHPSRGHKTRVFPCLLFSEMLGFTNACMLKRKEHGNGKQSTWAHVSIVST